MKNLAYITVDNSLTPREAADRLTLAKKSGFEDVFVLHNEDAPFYTNPYKEKLLSLFRGAYRSKVRLYIADDSFPFSGTGFGQVCSVRDVRQKGMCIKNKSEVAENEEIVAEKGDECVAIFVLEDSEAQKFAFYPDVTNPECARLVIDCVYAPLLREYNKFKGYEFAGFLCKTPVAPVTRGGATVYMKAVAERFEEEYKRMPDFFEIVKGEGDFENYARIAGECVKENFLNQLKNYCESNGVEFVVASCEDEYEDYCKKQFLCHLSEKKAESSYRLPVNDIASAVDSLENGMGLVVKIMPGMEKYVRLSKFFYENSDGEILEIKDFRNANKDCYILKGSQGEKVSFLLEGDWCVVDWESENVYDFDSRRVYDFGKTGFLCIRRKKAGMFTDPLPVRVGSVLTKELEVVQSLRFNREGNRFSFTLPEEGLGGKYVEIIKDGQYLGLKMGYNNYEIVSQRCVFPLYDYLSGAVCEGVCDDAREINILEKRSY